MTKEVNEKQDEPRAYECTFYADPEEPFLSFEPIRSGINIPLYAKPQAKEWIGLTTLEFDEIHESSNTLQDAMFATIMKLKEKNE